MLYGGPHFRSCAVGPGEFDLETIGQAKVESQGPSSPDCLVIAMVASGPLIEHKEIYKQLWRSYSEGAVGKSHSKQT